MEEKTINYGEALADYVSEQDYGTIIHYQEIEKVSHQRYGTQRFYSTIAKAKKILTKRGKMIKPIGHGDYQVLYTGAPLIIFPPCLTLPLANRTSLAYALE